MSPTAMTYATSPDDIKETAKGLITSFGADNALLEGAIAASLLREREACANVALKHSGVDRADNTRFVAHNIASAIRSRS